MPTRPPIHRPLGYRPPTRRHALYNRTAKRRAHQSLYDHHWRIYSKRRLSEHPWCEYCLKERGQHVRAKVTDHITPHQGDPVLFRDPSNHQSLCTTCHNRKTATEDGGFGRK